MFFASTQLYEKNLYEGLKSTHLQICKTITAQNCIFAIFRAKTKRPETI